MYVDTVFQAESATRSAVARSDGHTDFGEAMMDKKANSNVLNCSQQCACPLALRRKFCYLFDDFTILYKYSCINHPTQIPNSWPRKHRRYPPLELHPRFKGNLINYSKFIKVRPRFRMYTVQDGNVSNVGILT